MACIASCGGQGVGAALDYFISKGQIPDRDGGQVTWYHAANSKASTAEALKKVHRETSATNAGAAHMIEADVLLRGREPREPIMAHPPHSDSDITLQDWLNEVLLSDKGIKLDFKSLEAVQSSIRLLESVKSRQSRPLWINADILPGPNGSPGQAVEAKGFLDTVCPVSPHAVLSLGWTTGWSPQTENHGYSWEMVKEMEQICGALQQPVTFPVRAALLRQSFTQLHWLLQQSDRYSLSVWTGKDDVYPVEDLLYLRKNFDKSRIFYDITEAQDAAFKKAIGYSSIVK